MNNNFFEVKQEGRTPTTDFIKKLKSYYRGSSGNKEREEKIRDTRKITEDCLSIVL
jgi:hypothetical protein